MKYNALNDEVNIRGYAAIGLINPKCGENIGAALRACGVYHASMLALTGKRHVAALKHRTDTMKAYKSIPFLHGVEDIKTVIPYDCVPVAIELLEGATPLPHYKHPERAFYLFGAEDATLGKEITSFCRDIIYIPTDRCMNLAATVNVVLYDRLSKGMEIKQ